MLLFIPLLESMISYSYLFISLVFLIKEGLDFSGFCEDLLGLFLKKFSIEDLLIGSFF